MERDGVSASAAAGPRLALRQSDVSMTEETELRRLEGGHAPALAGGMYFGRRVAFASGWLASAQPGMPSAMASAASAASGGSADIAQASGGSSAIGPSGSSRGKKRFDRACSHWKCRFCRKDKLFTPSTRLLFVRENRASFFRGADGQVPEHPLGYEDCYWGGLQRVG